MRCSNWPKVGHGGRTLRFGVVARHALRHEARASEAGDHETRQETGAQGWSSGQSPGGAGADRRAEDAPRRDAVRIVRAALKRCAATRQRFTEDIPEGHHAGRHRAHDPSRLVPAVPEVGRTGRARRLAGEPDRQPGVDALRLAALRPGANHRPRGGRVQPSLADEGHGGRIGAVVVSLAGDSVSLVRADSERSVGRRRCCTATRRAGV